MVTLVSQVVQFNPDKPASGGNLHRSNFIVCIWTIFACAIEVFIQHLV
jgi:hypothetical protein